MLGGWEWVIILAIVLLVFGVGRISRIGGEFGQAVKEFRKGVRDASQTDDEVQKDNL